MSTSISSLASSFPGHACTPLPNGVKVLGRGATCMFYHHKKMRPRKKLALLIWETKADSNILDRACIVRI